MKRTTDPMVDIVHDELGHANVATSAFEKVWVHRGYRLRSDVEAEQAEALAAADAEAEAAVAKDEPEVPAAKAATPPAKPSVGETRTGDSTQSTP